MVGEFPFGSSWGRESSAGEVPYGDRACPPFFTSPGTERPPRSPEAPALSAHPQPRAKQIFLLRSHFARYQPLPCLLLRGTSHPPLPPGAAAFALEGVPSK